MALAAKGHFVKRVCTIFSLWKQDPPHQTFQSYPELTSAVSLRKQDPCAELFTKWMDFTRQTDAKKDQVKLAVHH